ncbi:MAG: hypothetical protein K0S11_1224 [Gammaproteobacteria bacterium]|jgi:hypothetical protein|nr:hypothetical protein [Gammaproteobacteria bacterium]
MTVEELITLLKISSQLVITATDNPTLVQEWLIDKPQDRKVVTNFIQWFENFPSVFKSLLNALKNPDLLDNFIIENWTDLGAIGRDVCRIIPAAQIFNARYAQYAGNLANFKLIIYLAQIKVLFYAATIAPQHAQILLVKNPDDIKQTQKLIQENLPADKLPIFLENLTKLAADPDSMIRFLEENKSLKKALLSEKTILIQRIKMIFEEKVFITKLIKSEPLIKLILNDKKAVRQHVTKAQWKIIGNFYKFSKKARNFANIHKIEVFLEAVKISAKNPNFLNDFLIRNPNIHKFLKENIDPLVVIAEIIPSSIIKLNLLDPLHPANPFNKQGIHFRTLLVINRLYQVSELMADSEAYNHKIRASFSQELLTKLSFEELLALNEVVENDTTANPFLSRFFKCFNEELLYQLEIKFIETEVLDKLDTTIKRLNGKNEFSVFAEITHNKVQVLEKLKNDIAVERDKLMASKAGLKPAYEAINESRENCRYWLDNALENRDINRHSNMVKEVVEIVTATLQNIKASFTQFCAKMKRDKAVTPITASPTEKANSATHYEYPGLFKTKTHKQLESVRDNISQCQNFNRRLSVESEPG